MLNNFVETTILLLQKIYASTIPSNLVFAGGSRQNVKGVSKGMSEKERKIGHRRVNEEGEVSYKKIQTNQLMASIQLGIQYSISR